MKSERSPDQLRINDRIVERRKVLKISQAQLAQLVGASQSAVANWESKRQVPTTEYLVSLAAVLEVSLAWLLTGETTDEGYINAVVRPIAQRLAELSELTKVERPATAVAPLSRSLRNLSPIQQAFLATVTSALSSGAVSDAFCVTELPRWHGLIEPTSQVPAADQH